MKLAALSLVFLPARGAEPAPPPGAPASQQMLEAAARQRRSVAAMAASVARQRAAVARMQRSLAGPGDWTPAARNPLALVTPEPPEPPSAGCRILSEAQISALAEAAGAKEGVAADLLRAVIEKESASDPCAVSRKGALGLMQLMPTTVTQLSVRDPFDPQESVGAGARLLKQLLQRYGGDLALALGAYNAGPARVDATGGVPQIQETIDYVNQILGRLSPASEDTSHF
jgi:soluble lytic murein transglycosylase-like protein